MNFKRVEVVN